MCEGNPFWYTCIISNHVCNIFTDPVRTESVVAYMLLADLMVVNKRHRRGIADLVREKYEREVASGTSVETICNRVSLVCVCSTTFVSSPILFYF